MGALLNAVMPTASALPNGMRALEKRLKRYLKRDKIQKVRRAYQLGASAHEGQTRKSGEPYITHPVAVAQILAEIGLDGDAIVAAILHDTIEDTPLTRADIEAEFGSDVADIVDGVTKLDKVHFRDRAEASAESFRKMVMAMARDLRVILIKLADRLHNMRTLGSMAGESRRRIARETLDIYAPIAQRLGMNRFKAELQDLAFAALYPARYRIISEHIQRMQGNRKAALEQIEHALGKRLKQEGIRHRVVSRVKSPYSIYSKMLRDRRPLAQVMDVYGFRVVVDAPMQCYHVLGAVHGLYKPVEARFHDYIAIPKANGYQSLHTVLIGPFDAPIEVQIRTEDMDTVAERGVAAHWAYKTDASGANNAQSRAREWLSGLVEAQAKTPSSQEFVENVKVDLFPDEVYVFSPKGDILTLPRGATVLDFAYAVHTDVGDHAVTARVDKKLTALRTRLESGQAVEIVTAPSAQPHAGWLEFAGTSKARTAIRQHLKRLQHEDAVDLGHRMLDRALVARGGSLDEIDSDALERYLIEARFKRLEELLSDIALGNRMSDQVATQLLSIDAADPQAMVEPGSACERILITGRERGVISFGNCCNPIPGDDIIGYLSAGKGVVVHQTSCRNLAEYRKTPERLVAIAWDRYVEGDYRVVLRIVVMNKPGVLASVAAAIAAAESNIVNVEYAERDLEAAVLLFTIEVHDRRHLAAVIRRVRHSNVVHSVQRTAS